MPFPVKVRVGFAPQSLPSETFLPLIIHSHPQTSNMATAQYKGIFFLFPTSSRLVKSMCVYMCVHVPV